MPVYWCGVREKDLSREDWLTGSGPVGGFYDALTRGKARYACYRDNARLNYRYTEFRALKLSPEQEAELRAEDAAAIRLVSTARRRARRRRGGRRS